MVRNNKSEQSEGTSSEFISGLTTTQHEIKDIISFLIMRRELIRDEILKQLELETTALVAKLQSLKGQALLEELECFKDILELHRATLEAHGEPGH